MKRVILDTNIVFSALVNSNGTIGDLIFNADDAFEFFTCNYLRTEIERHKNKLLKVSKLTEQDLETSWHYLSTKILFINEELIVERYWRKAEELVIQVDPDDIPFVALTMHLKGILWTGDLALFRGLKLKNYRSVYTTQDIIKLRKRITKN